MQQTHARDLVHVPQKENKLKLVFAFHVNMCKPSKLTPIKYISSESLLNVDSSLDFVLTIVSILFVVLYNIRFI